MSRIGQGERTTCDYCGWPFAECVCVDGPSEVTPMKPGTDDFGLSRANAERMVREKLGWPITGGPRTLDWGLYTLAVELQLQVLQEDSAKFECKARKQGTAGGGDPTDCNWPFCGCDPKADKVIAAIQESGLKIVKDGSGLDAAPDDGRTPRARNTLEYPSFWHCVDALCAACGGAISGVGPVCFMPPFGWIHVWTRGNGHIACAAARLWEIAPNKKERTR